MLRHPFVIETGTRFSVIVSICSICSRFSLQKLHLYIMAANPPLVQAQGTLFPAPYSGEAIALGRDGVEIALQGVRTQSGK